MSLTQTQAKINSVGHSQNEDMKEELGHTENKSPSGRVREKGEWRMKRLKFIMDVSETRARVMAQ